MRVASRGAVGPLLVQLIVALVAAALLSLALWRIGPLALLAALFPLLTVALLVAIGIVRAWPHASGLPWGRRGRGWGPGWGQRGDGWDPSGVREPRRPRPPYFPSRGEAVEPPVLPQESELRSLLYTPTTGGWEPTPTPKPQVTPRVGQTVKVIDGPFAEFAGTVSEVAPERTKVTVLVSFFGRETPVQLDFLQIEKQ